MTKIFISYTRKYLSSTQQLADRLEAEGYDVWWDVNLLAGHAFRDAIDEQLEASDVVIVIWTPTSIKSPWVIAEAQHAWNKNALLPLIHPDVDARDIPKPFGTLHSLPVDDFRELLKQLEGRCGVRPQSKQAAAVSPLDSFFQKKIATKNSFQTQPTPWDLSSLYSEPIEPAIRDDLTRLNQLCFAFLSTYRGRVSGLSGQELFQCLHDYGKISDLGGRIISYRGLRRYSNVRDIESRQALENAQASILSSTKQINFLTHELNRLSEPRLEQLYRDSLELRTYRPVLDRLRTLRPYLLSEEEERKFTDLNAAQTRLAQDFDDRVSGLKVEIDHPVHRNKTFGLERALTEMNSVNAEVAESAFIGLTDALTSQIEEQFQVHRRLILAKSNEDRARKLPSPEHSRLLLEGIQPSWMNMVNKAVYDGYAQTTHRYYAQKAKWFNVERMAYHRRNASIPFETLEFTWAEAVDTVCETFNGLSPILGNLVRRFFSEGWVDARLSDERAPGAFSHPTVFGANPFVHVHFNGGPRSAIGLGGMLAHGVFQYLGTLNGPLLDHFSTTLSSAFATFFETLVTELLMLRVDSNERIPLMAGLLEDRLNTIERQASYHSFERQLHDLVVANPEVNVNKICSVWKRTQENCVGPSIDVDPRVGVMWSYIPHFVHSPFVTSTYAFGGILASVMYANYLEDRTTESSGFVDKIIRAMKAGGTVDFHGALQILEIDPNDPTTWQRGVDVTSAIVDNLVDTSL